MRKADMPTAVIPKLTRILFEVLLLSELGR
jgi:hypothetical protein